MVPLSGRYATIPLRESITSTFKAKYLWSALVNFHNYLEIGQDADAKVDDVIEIPLEFAAVRTGFGHESEGMFESLVDQKPEVSRKSISTKRRVWLWAASVGLLGGAATLFFGKIEAVWPVALAFFAVGMTAAS